MNQSRAAVPDLVALESGNAVNRFRLEADDRREPEIFNEQVFEDN